MNKQKIIQTKLQVMLYGLPVGSQCPPRPVKKPIQASQFRLTVAPLLLILGTPVIVIFVWLVTAHYQGSVQLFIHSLQDRPEKLWAYLPMPSWNAVQYILVWIVIQWALLLFLPGKKFHGPFSPNGTRPEYRQNGILAWLVTHGVIFGILYPAGFLSMAKFYDTYGSLLVTLNIGAFLFCIFLYIKGRVFPGSIDTVYTGNLLFDFFQGIELYPAAGNVSLKQLVNCRVSMMGWSVIFIGLLLAQYEIHGHVNVAMIGSVTVLVIYLFKFFVWERGYLHSMDIIHDRFGYYICWGVLVWVPSVYCLPALYLVNAAETISPLLAGIYITAGCLAIWLNYSADRQRRSVRDTNGNCLVWGKKPRVIEASYTTGDGQEHSNLLLASGWWGISRHFHYIPELLLAVAWTIPAGFNHLLPWFYVIFLFILLIDRAVRDDKRCALKYGPYWEEYKKIVKWKVFPGIF